MSLISIIVPVYKVETYIHRCIDSILNQTFTDFELILVDDGSPDNCGAICDEYAAKDSRVVVIHQENGGLSAARNAGLDWAFSNSDSQWIAFIDSDDWVHEDYLKCLYEAVIKYNAKLSQCDSQDVLTEEIKVSLEKPVYNLVSPSEVYQKRGAVVAMRKLIHKELMNHIRFPVGKIHEDEYTTYKYVFATEEVVDVQNAEYYYYRIREDSIMHSAYSIRRLDAILAYEEQLEFFHKKQIYNMELFVARKFMNNMTYQYRMCRSSSIHNKGKILLGLRIKLISLMWRYHRDLRISPQKMPAVYETVFPITMWCYWTSVGIIRKIKRGFSSATN